MPLPAPYAPPWKRLGEDLVATLAWLGLKARELWRRNGEGTLPAPSFWPRRWLALFWPLALAGALGVALVLGRPSSPGATGLSAPGGSPSSRETGAPAVPAVIAPAEGLPSPPDAAALPGGDGASAIPAPPPAASGPMAPPASGPTAPSTEAPIDGPAQGSTDGPAEAPSAETGNGVEEEPGPGESEAPAEGPMAAAAEAPTLSEATRLRLAWRADDRDDLIADVTTDPAAATLTLQLNDRYQSLPPAKRQRRAEAWRQRASAAGYDHLRLGDGRGGLLGRDALVGGGMILLEPGGLGRPDP